jgi:diguanylate cyclase (GGDEF)-like protein
MLYNRRAFDERLDREWRDCLRGGQPLTVALLDIDHFKRFNDHYGHQAGDRALLRVAAVLAEVVRRPRDGAGRYGGEEFVLFLPETDLHGARVLLERVRANVEALAIPHAESSTAPVLTVSIGCVSETPTSTSGPEELVAQADQLLYRAKQQGRNRVLCNP